MGEVCPRLCSLLSQVVLLHLPSLSGSPGFNVLWYDVLNGMAAAVAHGQAHSEMMFETCSQTVINMVMCLKTQNVFESMCMDTGEDVFDKTCQILEPYCKNIRQQLTI